MDNSQKIFRLDGKTVVLTGSAGLLGQQHAKALAGAGANLVLLDLNEAAVSKQANELQKDFGIFALGIKMDITRETEVKKACAQAMEKFSRIDVLVNNAANNPQVGKDGMPNTSRLENFNLEQWNQDLAVGLTGAFLCAKYFGTEMAKKKGGSIINISSDLGLIAPDQRLYRKAGVAEDQQPVKPVTYPVIKSGLIGLTRYLATYWPKQGVRCNALCPGGVKTDQDSEFVKKIESLIPMGRMANASEYQGAIIFLASDASIYMNGAILSVDGGRTAW